MARMTWTQKQNTRMGRSSQNTTILSISAFGAENDSLVKSTGTGSHMVEGKQTNNSDTRHMAERPNARSRRQADVDGQRSRPTRARERQFDKTIDTSNRA
ncbi:hypothetical protein R1flu_009686 [Riccia fluitans]|uniref:Uncharacterized protein n=1 Tax=Riccia fluitans TaxID=41844 RepID=A0ABD1Z3W9_9MARC